MHSSEKTANFTVDNGVLVLVRFTIYRENPLRLTFKTRNFRYSEHILVFSSLIDIVASPVEKMCDAITPDVHTLYITVFIIVYIASQNCAVCRFGL